MRKLKKIPPQDEYARATAENFKKYLESLLIDMQSRNESSIGTTQEING